MRHPEPLFVTVWKEGIIPKCCHTCDHYTEDGICGIYGQEPPQEFTEEINRCDQWSSFDDIPF
jgi:hypothetical protein